MIKIPSLQNTWVNDINKIFTKSLDAVDPYQCVSRVIDLNGEILRIADTTINLKKIKNIYTIGVGKAVIPMAQAVENKFGKLIKGGFLITKHYLRKEKYAISEKIQIHIGSHPIPDVNSVESTKKLLKYIQNLHENDLIINLISGGGSSLMTLPCDGISLDDLKVLTRTLLKSGAVIQEINTIRKHIDQIKGGGLTRMTYPAQMVSLILSDVIGDDISMIASAPTIQDKSTFKDSMAIIRKYKIENEIPDTIIKFIQKGINEEKQEPPEISGALLENSINMIVGSLSMAIDTAEKTAQNLGYKTIILSRKLIGEARLVGKAIALNFINACDENVFSKRSICLIAGGETTVTVQGGGKGGRNQELVLSAINQLDDHNNCCMLSIATDGEDGPTDAAGAFITGRSLKIAKTKGLDPLEYLKNNDSYTFFDQMGNLIKLGPTGTNVNDLLFLFSFY